MKKAILLVNMGGALSRKELKHFLFRMFTDVHILPLPKLPRYVLAFLISRLRYRMAWKKYRLIGGTPIIQDSLDLAQAVQQYSNTSTEVAFSYSKPFIKDKLSELSEKGFTDITIIPLYPQKSTTTTDSVKDEVRNLKPDFPHIQFHFIDEFYQHSLFTEYWVQLIKEHFQKEHIRLEDKPTLLFSAHSLPLSVIEKGDTYPESVELGAKNIAKKLGLEYQVVYQSKIRKSSWYGEEPDEMIQQLIQNGKKHIVIVPISFVSECLETIYDLDIDLIPSFEKEQLEGVHISRVQLPKAHPIFVEMLSKLH